MRSPGAPVHDAGVDGFTAHMPLAPCLACGFVQPALPEFAPMWLPPAMRKIDVGWHRALVVAVSIATHLASSPLTFDADLIIIVVTLTHSLGSTKDSAAGPILTSGLCFNTFPAPA